MTTRDPYAAFEDVTNGSPAPSQTSQGDPYAAFEDVTNQSGGADEGPSGAADFAYQAAGPGFNKGLADLIDLPGNLVAGAGRMVGIDMGSPSSALTRWPNKRNGRQRPNLEPLRPS